MVVQHGGVGNWHIVGSYPLKELCGLVREMALALTPVPNEGTKDA